MYTICFEEAYFDCSATFTKPSDEKVKKPINVIMTIRISGVASYGALGHVPPSSFEKKICQHV